MVNLQFKQRTICSVDRYKNVEEFLDTKSRNSKSQNTISNYLIGVGYFETFLRQYAGGKYNVETIISPLIKKKLDVYQLLDKFVGFLDKRNPSLSPRTISSYVIIVRSYLGYMDLDISPQKFKNRVTLPKKPKLKKKALDSQAIRTLLQACTNQRLKALLCMLASSGARVMEILTLKNSDIDLSKIPVRISLKAENTKTDTDRDILVSKEAVEQLKMFLIKKYGSIEGFKQYPNHLLFANDKDRSELYVKRENNPKSVKPVKIYAVMHRNFKTLLRKVNMDSIRSGDRRSVNFHLLRSYTKTTVAKQTNSDFSEHILGHAGSTYWTSTDKEIEELYLKCEPFLTFLSYNTVESIGRDFESKIQEKDVQIKNLNDSMINVQARLDLFEEEDTIREDLTNKMKSLAGNNNKELSEEDKMEFKERFDNLTKKWRKIKTSK